MVNEVQSVRPQKPRGKPLRLQNEILYSPGNIRMSIRLDYGQLFFKIYRVIACSASSHTCQTRCALLCLRLHQITMRSPPWICNSMPVWDLTISHSHTLRYHLPLNCLISRHQTASSRLPFNSCNISRSSGKLYELGTSKTSCPGVAVRAVVDVGWDVCSG